MVTTTLLLLLLLKCQCTFSKTLFNKTEIIPLLDNNRAVLTANIDVSNFNNKMERFISEEIPAKIKGNLAQYTESERFKSLVRNESKDEIYNFTHGIVNDLFNSFIHGDKFRRNLTTFTERFLGEKFAFHIMSKEFKAFIESKSKEQIKEISANLINDNEMLKKRVDNIEKIAGFCNSRNCYNGGKCLELLNSYKCECAVGYLGDNCEFSDGTAFDFLLVFHEGWKGSTKPVIQISGTTLGIIYLSYFNNKHNTFIPLNKNIKHALQQSVLMEDGIHNAGVNIHSSTPIRVFGFVYERKAVAGILVLPSQYASTQYLIPSYKIYEKHEYHNSVFSLTPLHSNTTININLKMKTGTVRYNGKDYTSSQTITFKLDQLRTYQLSHSSDLTGTFITSSKPIVVVSGNKCNKINNANSNCNPFMEMVLPCNQLDNLYVIPYLKTRPLSTVRILAGNNSALEILQNDIHKIDRLSTRDYLDFKHSRISIVNSSTDILVTMFPHEVTKIGDAFMMPIPGVNQYLYDYNFIVPSTLTFNSFISITVPSNALLGFVLDYQELSIPNTYNISHNSNHYSSFCLPISKGYHRLLHLAKVRFGLWVYGDYDMDAYGFPAGIAFKTTE